MLSQLPLEILIKIIKYLNFHQVINLMEVKNKKLFYACQYYEKIILRLYGRKNKLYNYFPNFHNLIALDIQDGNICKNKILQMAIKKEWKLKKIIFNNARTIKDELLTEFLKKTQTIRELVFFNCPEFNNNHLNLLNKKLKNLKLRYNYLNISSMKILNNFTDLENLDLSYSQEIFSFFPRLYLPNLKVLNFTSVSFAFDESFFTFVDKIKDLKKIHLDFNPFSGNVIDNVNKYCPKLEEFTYSNSITEFNDFFFQYKWQYLKTIDFSFGVFNDDMFMAVIDSANKLENINLDLTSITDFSVIYMSVKLRNIKKLNISRNIISNYSASNIAYHCNNLMELDISGTKISTPYVNRIIDNTKLDYLIVMSCNNIEKRFLNNVSVLVN